MQLTGQRHPQVLTQHLLMQERLVVATRRHWISLAEPALTPLLGFLVISWLVTVTAPRNQDVLEPIWWLWLALVARFLWKVIEWGQEWFAVTDKRLLLTYGVVTRHVAMMPLRKVTDLNYMRVPLGKVLGYGTFVFESAGQDQAMRQVKYLPDPDHVYQRIGDAVFGIGGIDVDEDNPAPRDPAMRDRIELAADDPYAVESNPVDGMAAADEYEARVEVWRSAGEGSEEPGQDEPDDDDWDEEPVEEEPDGDEPDDDEPGDDEREEDSGEHDAPDEDDEGEGAWSVSHEAAAPYVRLDRGAADDEDSTGPIPRPGEQAAGRPDEEKAHPEDERGKDEQRPDR